MLDLSWWIGQLSSVFYLEHNQGKDNFWLTSKLRVLCEKKVLSRYLLIESKYLRLTPL